MPDINSLTTFSGLLAFFATLGLLHRRFTPAAILLVIAGAGGTAIAWDRWSLRAGDDVHVTALISGRAPTASEAAMFITHLPLLAIGLGILILAHRRSPSA
jgi:hypothetical protein